MKNNVKKGDDLLEIIAREVVSIGKNMATKEDLLRVEMGIREDMATKKDLQTMEDRLTEVIEGNRTYQEDEITDLQGRAQQLEKDVRIINRHLYAK